MAETRFRPSRLKGVPIFSPHTSVGNIFWVGNGSGGGVTGSDDADGLGPDRPKATLDAAYNLAANARGDTVYVLGGHVETLAATTSLDTDNVSIVGVEGNTSTHLPFLTVGPGSAATEVIDVTRINHLKNLWIIPSAASQATLIDFSAAGASGSSVRSCVLDDNNVSSLNHGVTISAASTGPIYIEDNYFYGDITSSNNDHAIEISNTALKTIIKNNYIFGDYDEACIESGSAHTLCEVRGNTLINLLASQHAIEFSAAATGVIADNYLGTDNQATALDPGSCYCFNNQWTPSGDQGAVEVFGTGGSLGQRVSKTGVSTDATADLFTITGKNLITLIHGEMTTVEAGATTSLTAALNMKTNSVDIMAATGILSDAAGTLYMVSGDQDDLANAGDAPTVDHAHIADATHSPIIVDGDTIEMTIAKGGGTSTGVIRWDLYYIPLEAGAGIVAA